jgi:hypothetical protein
MTLEDEYTKALLDIIKQESSPEVVKAKALILRRIATENSVAPSRIPEPLNITQIGGYINLLETLGHKELQYGTLASILGQPLRTSEAQLYDREPISFFSEFISDRPDCSGVAGLPLMFALRSDFTTPFARLLRTLHEQEASLPVLAPRPALPAIGYTPVGDVALELIGRFIEICPASAFTDPETDPIVVTAKGLYARGGKTEITVTAFKNTDGVIENVEVTADLIELEPLLALAGWYPVGSESPYDALKLINISGLVVGRTTYGDELSRLYTGAQVTASGVREALSWIWNGKEFVQN